MNITRMWASLMAQMVKNLPVMQEMRVQSLGQEDPLEKEMATTSVFLPGKSHGQRSWPTSPWGCKRVGQDLATKQKQQVQKSLRH